VKLISNSENLGFAKANNQAIKEATGDFILLLNPDMKVFPDTLNKMLDFAKNNPQATVSGCKLVSSKGEVIKQVRRFPQLFDQLTITLKIPHLFPKIVDKYLQVDFDYGKSAKVDSLRGAFFLINKESYQQINKNQNILPLLDERYFIWFEEVDFCRQVYKLGGEIWYAPEAVCLDYVGSSFSQVKRGLAQKYFQDSMLKYFLKWEKKWQYNVLKAAWKLIGVIL
ncbi:MAG: glycosyltransferase, partial [Patescibacteria group bacterium]